MHPSNALIPHLCPAAAARERRVLSQSTPWLHNELARQMAQRLTVLRQAPQRWLDWLPQWGGQDAAEAIAAVFPKAQRWVYDEPSPKVGGLLARWRQAIKPGLWDGHTPVDMVWASMGLRSEPEPETLFARWQQALVPGGLLMFSALGPHSLLALREVFSRYGWGEAATPFVDMHDWGDQLVRAGFADPVMDTSLLNLTYSSPEALLSDLRAMGRNTHSDRWRGCRTPRWRDRVLDALHKDLPRDEQGRWFITLEVIWGQAWRPVMPRAQAGETRIDAHDMRRMLRRNIQ